MKKLIVLSLMFSFLLVSAGTVKADTTTCGLQSDGVTFISCGNGMPMPEPSGWVHYAPGVGGCPIWFSPQMGCAGPAGL